MRFAIGCLRIDAVLPWHSFKWRGSISGSRWTAIAWIRPISRASMIDAVDADAAEANRGCVRSAGADGNGIRRKP
jgi:hypothetical protein